MKLKTLRCRECSIAVKLVLQDYPYFQIQDILNVSLGFITKWKQALISQGIERQKIQA